jgi:small-conductance mechanosensitive channel
MLLALELPSFLAEPLADARIRAALILAVSIIVARVVDALLCGLLGRIARRTASDVDDQMIALLHRPIFYSLVTLGIHQAASTLTAPDPAPSWLEKILKTALILLWSVNGTRAFSAFLQWLALRRRSMFVHPNTLPLFVNLTTLFVIGGAVYFVLLTWEIDVSGWVASAGIAGIAVGFAAKDTLANFFAGIFIATDAPYKVGDYIVLDSGERGRVTHIGLRSTRLLTRDDIEVTLPNSIIGNAKIANESGGPWERHRIRVAVSVAYGSDIDQVRTVLDDTASRSPLVCDQPEPRVRFRSFGDSGLQFELLCWIEHPEDRGRALDELNSEIYKRFRREGIEIPFPKRDLYVRQMPSPSRED